jgi:arabinose-5-phosphate isomerase
MTDADSLPRNDIRVAQRVFARDIKGLQMLSRTISDAFIDAVDVLAGIKGKIVVSGMGKSGHIAQKVAATLASTGAPAHYMHPAEAGHGDLGMVSGGDALVLFSNSGETHELLNLVSYARHLRAPLISVVGRPRSSLSVAADVVLLLPAAEEGCPHGLAPTTSTLMMLALGDALAMALMERRGFTPADFHLRHPGGRLGSRFVTVGDIMHGADALPLARQDASMAEALLTMTGCRFGCVGIVDADERMVGIITDGDLRRHMDSGLMSRQAQDLMTRNPCTVQAEVLASEALAIMNERQVSCLFVTDGSIPHGILHIHDIVRAGLL